VFGFDGTVAVLLGNGDGTFQPAVSYNPGSSDAISVAVADVNGDGKLDLLVANYTPSNSVAVLLGNGDGTFQAPVTYSPGGQQPISIAVADVNGDGKPDLLVANVAYSVGVLLGNGDGTFQPALSYAPGGLNPLSITAADLNGDGELDLVVGNISGIGNTDGSVGVLLNNTGPRNPTTTTVVSNLSPVAPKEMVTTYTATVTGQSGAVTGTVVFTDFGSTIATVPLAGNQAAYSTFYTTTGVHSITATYLCNKENAGSTSTMEEDVEPLPFHTTTVVTSSGSPALVGQPVTFTASISLSYPGGSRTIPNGDLVTFYDGTTAIGTGTTASSVATFVTSSLTAKTHTIKATYAGDVKFRQSTGVATQIVNKYPSTTALSSNLNPSVHGQAVIFSATVTSSSPNPPTGTVIFRSGTTAIGTATLSGATAKLTKSTLPVGTHPITAQYSGDAASGQSTSSVVNQVVQ